MSSIKVNYVGWIILLAFVVTGCTAEQDSKNASSGSKKADARASSGEITVESVNTLIKDDQYERVLGMLNRADHLPDSTRQRLQEKAHLNYGLYLEYRGGDRSMRERMTNALRQYIEVLRINRQNQKAISEIQQIMGIYRTMPDKSPPAEIKKDLNELGVRY